MEWKVALAVGVLCAAEAPAHAVAPLYDAIALNIGVNCQWQQRCIGKQRRAMNEARKYIAKYNPPLWRIHLCNRNAGRTPDRVDWIGFNNCIRNTALQSPTRKHRRR